jgi:hypothetical protein
VLAVGVKIGELAGVDSESPRFCFDALVQDTGLPPLSLADRGFALAQPLSPMRPESRRSGLSD